MYKNRLADSNNRCGQKIAALRKAHTPKLSQRALADQMQLQGLDLDKNAIQRIEAGKRFVTDIELYVFAQFFGVTADELLGDDE
ncbi:MAG: helix-turn-helix transcriptional regulator [Clostridiales bacterium]|nr:helix-turn-helix transcriptional regulator [Candidatus Cacconaster stercorequi]